MSSSGRTSRMARATVSPPSPLSSTTMGEADGDWASACEDGDGDDNICRCYRTCRRRGLTFIPGTRTLREHPPEPRRTSMSESLKDKKVLLVDDDSDILTSM